MNESQLGLFIVSESVNHIPVKSLGFKWVDRRTNKLRNFIIHIPGDPGLAAEALQNMADGLRQVAKEQAKSGRSIE